MRKSGWDGEMSAVEREEALSTKANRASVRERLFTLRMRLREIRCQENMFESPFIQDHRGRLH